MTNSKLIAGLMGPVLAVLGLSVLVNHQAFGGIAERMASDTGLVILSGILSLVAGLAIVRVHNVWSGWPMLVTIFGWLAIVGGVMRLVFPQLAPHIVQYTATNPTTLMVVGGTVALLGSVLSFKAYSAE